MDVTRHLDEIEGLNMAVQEMQSLKNIADRQVEDWTVSEMIEMETSYSIKLNRNYVREQKWDLGRRSPSDSPTGERNETGSEKGTGSRQKRRTYAQLDGYVGRVGKARRGEQSFILDI